MFKNPLNSVGVLKHVNGVSEHTTASFDVARTSLRSQRGFTLMEILLAMLILIFLMAAAMVGVDAYRRSRALRSAAGAWGTALKMADAEASVRGRRLTLNFTESDDENGSPTVSLEYQPDPLDNPGETVRLQLNWLGTLNDKNLRILSAGPPLPPSVGETDQDAPPLQPISFYPDGSSDSARIVIAPVDENDTRRLVVELVGETGRISTEIIDAADLEGKE